jgi:hypothetical protein
VADTLRFITGSTWARAREAARSGALAKSVTLCALLDRPDSRSMGLLPVVLDTGDGFRISGATVARTHLVANELDELIAEGHALAVDRVSLANVVGPVCAAWIGNDFASAILDTDCPTLPFDTREMIRVRGLGWYRVDSPARVFGALDGWLHDAFVAAIDRRDRGIAELMSWVFPNRDETRAALCITGEAEQRARDLSWWARLSRDAGEKLEEDDLWKKMAAICERTLIDWRPPAPSLWIERETPWERVAVAARCAERLAPAIVDPRVEVEEQPVYEAIRIAKEAALLGRPADRAAVEKTRVELLQVGRQWQEARLSAHIHPDALHAVESALFAAEREPEQSYASQSVLSLRHGIFEIAYPEITWRDLPGLKGHFEAAAERPLDDDLEWLRRRVHTEGVNEAFFERDLWPGGAPPGWPGHLARFREKLFRSGAKTEFKSD